MRRLAELGLAQRFSWGCDGRGTAAIGRARASMVARLQSDVDLLEELRRLVGDIDMDPVSISIG